jgi:hypothetical protein
MKKIYFVILILILLGLCGTILVVVMKRTSGQPTQPAVYQGQTVTNPNESFEKKTQDHFLEIADRSIPDALTELRERSKNERDIVKICHGIAHKIGRFAFKKYGNVNDALQYQDDVCGSGYMHGVVEEYMSTTKNVYDDMMTVCQQYGAKCYHGMGHGFMYFTLNDLPRSLQYCDRYEEDFQRTNCYDGVFMENFETDGSMHDSEYLKKDDTFYICRISDEKYKDNCYFYAPRYFLLNNPDKYNETFSECRKAEPGYIASCLRGVGSVTMKENLNDIPLVESVCVSGTVQENEECISGMISYYTVNYDSTEKAKELCQQMLPENQPVCLKKIPANPDVLGAFTHRYTF